MDNNIYPALPPTVWCLLELSQWDDRIMPRGDGFSIRTSETDILNSFLTKMKHLELDLDFIHGLLLNVILQN